MQKKIAQGTGHVIEKKPRKSLNFPNYAWKTCAGTLLSKHTLMTKITSAVLRREKELL